MLEVVVFSRYGCSGVEIRGMSACQCITLFVVDHSEAARRNEPYLFGPLERAVGNDPRIGVPRSHAQHPIGKADAQIIDSFEKTRRLAPCPTKHFAPHSQPTVNVGGIGGCHTPGFQIRKCLQLRPIGPHNDCTATELAGSLAYRVLRMAMGCAPMSVARLI